MQAITEMHLEHCLAYLQPQPLCHRLLFITALYCLQHSWQLILALYFLTINPISANPTKWSNTLKKVIGKSPTNCLIVFDHFVGLALKELIFNRLNHEIMAENAELTFHKNKSEHTGIFKTHSHIYDRAFFK